MNYQKIVNNDMVNGEGLRVTLFVSGCEHACRGCYNQSTWNPNNGFEFTNKEVDEIIALLNPPHISGLSLSGGDPLLGQNLPAIHRLIKRVRSVYGNTKTIWMWTGYQYSELDPIRKMIADLTDVVIDGKFIKELHDPSLQWRGSSNQIINTIKGSG